MEEAIVLICVMQPVPIAATIANTQKITDSIFHFFPSPSSM